MLKLKEATKNQLNSLIEKHQKKYKIKGLAISIQEGEQPIYETLIGLAGENKPVDKTTQFMIGSTTKVFTALAILQLKDQEKLTLDDAITTYLKPLNIHAYQEHGPITIRHLLMHTSGLPGDDLDLMFSEGKPQKDILNHLKNHHMTTEPGRMFAYSNIGYALLGLMVEKVSQLSYKEYVEKHIFKPLGVNIQILETEALRKKHTKNLSVSYDKKGRIVTDPLSVFISAGSSTYASLEDMQKLASYFLNNNQPKLLKQATFDAMITPPQDPYIVKNEHRIGLGIRFNYARYNHADVGVVYGHGGNTFYHHSLFDILPKHKLAINILNNSKKGGQFNQKLIPKLIATILKDKGIDMPKSLDNPSQAIPKEKAQRLAMDMVMLGQKMPLRLNKKQELTGKLSFLKFNVEQCEDGLLKMIPQGIAKLKIFKKHLVNLRMLPKTIVEEDVMFFEVNRDYNRLLIATASNYEHPKIPETWLKSLGKYTPMDHTHNVTKFVTGIKLIHKKNDLILTLKTPESSNAFYLLPLDDEKAIIQGYGRNSKETITLSFKDNTPTLTIQGLLCHKV